MKDIPFDSAYAKARYESSSRLWKLDERHTGLQGFYVRELFYDLADSNVDVRFLDEVLMNFGLSLNDDISTPTFKEVKSHYAESRDSRFDFLYFDFDAFQKAFDGFTFFCQLFFQNEKGNINVSDLKKRKYEESALQLPVSLYMGGEGFPQNRAEYMKLLKQIFEFVSGIQIPTNREFPDSINGLEDLIIESLKSNPDNQFLSTVPLYQSYREREHLKAKAQSKGIDIGSMKFEELNRLYLEEVYQRSQGNINEVARRAGLPRSTVRDDLVKAGIIPIRKEKNQEVHDEK